MKHEVLNWNKKETQPWIPISNTFITKEKLSNKIYIVFLYTVYAGDIQNLDLYPLSDTTKIIIIFNLII